MLSILFAALMVFVFGKILIFAAKAAWGIARICLFVIFLPIVLIVMAIGGLFYIALPILIIIGIVSLLTAN